MEVDKERENLVLQNINLAYSIAHKYKGNISTVYDFEDISQICLEALIQAANTYDFAKNIEFSTYAYTVIKNKMFTLFNINLKKEIINPAISLNSFIFDDDKISLEASIPSDVDIENDFVDTEKINTLYKYVLEFDYPKKEIFLLRLQDKTFKDIGRILNLSESTINVHYQKGLNILRYKYKKNKELKL